MPDPSRHAGPASGATNGPRATPAEPNAARAGRGDGTGAGTATLPVAVLLSGRGSNMIRLVEGAAGYRVVLVASDRPDAAGLGWARERGLPTFALSPRGIGKPAFEAALDRQLRAHGAEAIALAGYMRLLSPAFVARWAGRIVNIHPSLLPAYKGLDTHARALAAGDAEAGCSVHLVTDELDAGTVLGQARVPVLPGDTPDALAARVLLAEHQLYPRILSEFCRAMTTTDPATADPAGNDPAARVRDTALALPEAEAAGEAFRVAGEPFAEMTGDRLRVRGEAGWEDVDLGADPNWADVDARIARAWELVAPARLLEAGGR